MCAISRACVSGAAPVAGVLALELTRHCPVTMACHMRPVSCGHAAGCAERKESTDARFREPVPCPAAAKERWGNTCMRTSALRADLLPSTVALHLSFIEPCSTSQARGTQSLGSLLAGPRVPLVAPGAGALVCSLCGRCTGHTSIQESRNTAQPAMSVTTQSAKNCAGALQVQERTLGASNGSSNVHWVRRTCYAPRSTCAQQHTGQSSVARAAATAGSRQRCSTP